MQLSHLPQIELKRPGHTATSSRGTSPVSVISLPVVNRPTDFSLPAYLQPNKPSTSPIDWVISLFQKTKHLQKFKSEIKKEPGYFSDQLISDVDDEIRRIEKKSTILELYSKFNVERMNALTLSSLNSATSTVYLRLEIKKIADTLLVNKLYDMDRFLTVSLIEKTLIEFQVAATTIDENTLTILSSHQKLTNLQCRAENENATYLKFRGKSPIEKELTKHEDRPIECCDLVVFRHLVDEKWIYLCNSFGIVGALLGAARDAYQKQISALTIIKYFRTIVKKSN